MKYFNYDTIDSTNVEATRILQKENHPQNFVVTAKHQSNGHGKGNNEFYSPKDTGLYFSIVQKYDPIRHYSGLITLIIGVSIIKGFKKLNVLNLKLKWVNDIVNSRGKVGGILVLQTNDIYDDNYIIAGVGINLLMPINLPKKLSDIVGSVWIEPISLDNDYIRSILISEIISEINDSDSSIMQLYTSYSSLVGKNICLKLGPHDQTSGVVNGFSENGGILINNNGIITEYQTGDILS